MNAISNLERRPKLACEITADHVIAARASEDGQSLDTCSVRTLPSGAVSPGLTNANIANRDALSTTVVDALATIASKHRDIILVIPDAACRISLLDFDELPAKPHEADSVVRFRLKKSLPFEIEHAKLSYDVRRANGSVRVIATVALPSVVEEYESVIRNAGFAPGFVVPSTVASLGLVDASRPTLVVKIASDTTSMAIVNGDDLLLFRTTENAAGATVDADQLAEDIYPSLVFFQDTYSLKVNRIVIAGAQSFESLVAPIEASTGVRPQELIPQHAVSSASIGSAQRPFVAGIVGALIS